MEEELGRLEQEDLDEKMLKTGTVPVLPSGLNGPRKSTLSFPSRSRAEDEIPDWIGGPMGSRPGECVVQQKGKSSKGKRANPRFLSVVKGAKVSQPAEEEDEEELRKLQAEMAM